MRLRIHHFFDIIRDFGSGKNIEPHEFGHSYHLIAKQILGNPNLELTLVVASDDICKGCSHLIDNICDDLISHREDFSRKEDFNNHLDVRIMTVCDFISSEEYTPQKLCSLAVRYLENIEHIYKGNDVMHTEARKQNVLKGLQKYAEKHEFNLRI